MESTYYIVRSLEKTNLKANTEHGGGAALSKIRKIVHNSTCYLEEETRNMSNIIIKPPLFNLVTYLHARHNNDYLTQKQASISDEAGDTVKNTTFKC